MKPRFRTSTLLAVAMLGLASSALAQDAASGPPNPRIALVIGEQAYPDRPAATSANDAGLVAQVLQGAGFDVVGASDLDENSIRAALRDFLAKANGAGPDMQAFVYFAGRAVQYQGDNFLVPIDARIARDSDAPIEAVRLSDFTHALAGAPGLARIVVVDGARANPYAQQGAPLAGGLALVDPEPGELLAFNAAPGSISGAEPGPYGVYAKTLSGLMREGGVSIDDVFAQTRVAVNQATGGAQVPWSVSHLAAPYYVFERAADAPALTGKTLVEDARRPIATFPAEEAYAAALQRDTMEGYEQFLEAYPRSAQARRVRAILAARREAMFWRRAVAQDTPRAYWTYLRRYPRGPHAAEADRRLEFLRAEMAPPPDFAPEDFADLPPPPPDEIIYADRPVYMFDGPDYGPPPEVAAYGFYYQDDDWRDLPPPPPPVAYGVLPVLAVAVPLLLTARAYHDRGRHDGRAQVGAPPPPPHAFAPPPLPPGVQPRPIQIKPGATSPSLTPSLTPSPTPTLPPKGALTPPPTLTPLPKGVAPPLTPQPKTGLPSPTPTLAPLPKGTVAPLTPSLKTQGLSPTPVPTLAPKGALPSTTPKLNTLAPARPLQHVTPPSPQMKLHAAPPASPIHIAPQPQPQFHAAPPPAHIAPPQPQFHAAPPPVHIAPPQPQFHAAPPPVHIAPPQPQFHAPPPQPQMRVAPPPQPRPASPGRPPCGVPGTPACPK